LGLLGPGSLADGFRVGAVSVSTKASSATASKQLASGKRYTLTTSSFLLPAMSIMPGVLVGKAVVILTPHCGGDQAVP